MAAGVPEVAEAVPPVRGLLEPEPRALGLEREPAAEPVRRPEQAEPAEAQVRA